MSVELYPEGLTPPLRQFNDALTPDRPLTGRAAFAPRYREPRMVREKRDPNGGHG